MTNQKEARARVFTMSTRQPDCNSGSSTGTVDISDFWFTASDHYFCSVCLSVCLFVCAEFFSDVFDPISIKLGHVICLGLVVSPRI